MNKKSRTFIALLGGTGLMLPLVAGADAALDQLRQTVETQGQTINELRRQLDATATLVENAGLQKGTSTAGASSDTTIGGYGELHYANLDSMKELDFHRFVLFFGHRFSDTIRLNSELELEHAYASAEDPGEVEVEQAYIDFDLNERSTARAGLFLMPVGILNETHEPPTFYGVERNPVESNIIPTTWREGGGGLNGELAPGWRYDVAVTSGLNVPTTGGNAYRIRSGRQQAAKATAEKLAYTARLRWTGLPGVELAGTVNYQDDVTQGVQGVSAILVETHAVVHRGPFGLRALYAQWNLDGNGPHALGLDVQRGWYIEPSYRFSPSVGIFARYNEWDNAAGDDADSKATETSFGVNYWPHENVVLKADIQRQGGIAGDDGFHLGLGYQF